MSNETPQPRDRPEDTEPVARHDGDPSHATQPAVAPSPPGTATDGYLVWTGSAPGPAAQRRHGVAGRAWSLRTVAAAAVTAVALSGVGGAALASASEGGSDRGGPGHGGFGGPPGAGRLPGRAGTGQTGQPPTGQPPTGVPGRTPPGTTGGSNGTS